MKLADTRLKKSLLIITISILGLAALSIILMSPIAKYLIEKYDDNFLGRKVEVDWVYANPFTGYVYIDNLRITEGNKDTIFFAAESVDGNFAMHKLFSRTVELTELNVYSPLGIIIQKKDTLNFSDIIRRFTPGKTGKGSSWHVNINQLNINDGVFHYNERVIPIKYFIEKVNLTCSDIRWDSDTIASTFAFASRGGQSKGRFMINTRTLDYNFTAIIKNQDLEIIRQYLWELINYGMFRAQMDANVKAYGNFKDPRRITMQGRLAFSDFHLGKTTTEDYLAFKKVVLVMDELSPVNKKFLFDSVTLDKPYVNYEHFDSLDNIQALFGKEGANIKDITDQSGRFNLVIEISRYLKTLARDFFVSQYSINTLAVNDADLKYTDFALNEKFDIAAQHLYLRADSVSKTNKRVKFNLRCDIYPYGNLTAQLSLNPLDSGDLDFVYNIHKVPITAFNPYIISYTSFPLDRGILELNGKWKVRDGMIKSENNLLIKQPRVASRQKNKDIKKKLPLPLIMALVRERGDVINYTIPITGNLKDPNLHLRDVLTDLLKNIFIKPATLPYAMEVRSTEKNVEAAQELTWQVHQTAPDKEQEKFLRTLARFMKENKETSIAIYPQEFMGKERERILFYETKKKYFLQMQHKEEKDFSKEDSVDMENMSVKDIRHELVKDMVKILRDTTMFTIHDKCLYFLGDDRVDRKYRQLLIARETAFLSYFKEADVAGRVTIHADLSSIPYNGFSCYLIKYKGDVPKSLTRAYESMNNLNRGIFRRKYFTD